ncbi:hypothetical protein LTR17_027346 [Elasticomyces elasticus]|nr:hypothetical protein LTR17_027346 [Elasticomyces elasticus]
MGLGHYDEMDGLVAVYYLPGPLDGAFWDGWLGDRYGRITTIAIADLWAIIGATFQCSAQNAKQIFCARVFNGIGTGVLNAVTPVWATETASPPRAVHSWLLSSLSTCSVSSLPTGLSSEFLRHVTPLTSLTCSGSSFYGDGTSSFIWRSPIAFQIVPLIDRIGRRWTLYWGAVGQGICCFAAGGLSYATQNATGSDKTHVGGAAVFFVYLFTAIFGATWLTVPWLYPAEGVVGWSIGNGWCVLLLPTIFAALGEKTLNIFGSVNVLAIIVVWALYPETNQRTLEEMSLVFASDSIWEWEAEKNFKILQDESPGLVKASRMGSLSTDPETGFPQKDSVERRISLISQKDG